VGNGSLGTQQEVAKAESRWKDVRRENSESDYHIGACRRRVINSHERKTGGSSEDFAGYVQALQDAGIPIGDIEIPFKQRARPASETMKTMKTMKTTTMSRAFS